jgi:hypothetical protein
MAQITIALAMCLLIIAAVVVLAVRKIRIIHELQQQEFDHVDGIEARLRSVEKKIGLTTRPSASASHRHTSVQD